jgi:endonuclease YncB( thermonuclease family)
MGNCLNNSIEKSRLKRLPDNINSRKIKPFIPNINYGKVVKIYDGDTLTIVSYLPKYKSLYKFKIRLARIDCPELQTKNKIEKKISKIARDEVYNIVGINAIIKLQNIKLDKYGRLLADIYNKENVCINDYLLDKRLAVKYDGGTKNIPKNWEKYYLNGKLN